MQPVLRLRQRHDTDTVNDLSLVMPGDQHHLVAGLRQAFSRPVKDPAVERRMHRSQKTDLGTTLYRQVIHNTNCDGGFVRQTSVRVAAASARLPMVQLADDEPSASPSALPLPPVTYTAFSRNRPQVTMSLLSTTEHRRIRGRCARGRRPRVLAPVPSAPPTDETPHR
jgi:hypothetical protein